jgi:hypothetical protein
MNPAMILYVSKGVEILSTEKFFGFNDQKLIVYLCKYTVRCVCKYIIVYM